MVEKILLTCVRMMETCDDKHMLMYMFDHLASVVKIMKESICCALKKIIQVVPVNA